MSSGQRFTQVDAFTDRAFTGNPAAVCMLPAAGDPRWMQQVAGEMNLAETAFLVRRPDGFDLRWFTPLVEVDLCGHATLASAHVLWEEGYLEQSESAGFHTRSGLLTATRRENLIWLDFPATPVFPAVAPAGLDHALGCRIEQMGRTAFDCFVEVDSETTLRAVSPDMTALARLPARGTIVTARSEGGEHDFVSRFFAPQFGIPEDPVTGSAHCALGPFWAGRLGKTELRGYQASARGGTVLVKVDEARVQLGGRAVTVLRGEILY